MKRLSRPSTFFSTLAPRVLMSAGEGGEGSSTSSYSPTPLDEREGEGEGEGEGPEGEEEMEEEESSDSVWHLFIYILTSEDTRSPSLFRMIVCWPSGSLPEAQANLSRDSHLPPT